MIVSCLHRRSILHAMDMCATPPSVVVCVG
jgi:hypothetical protein